MPKRNQEGRKTAFKAFTHRRTGAIRADNGKGSAFSRSKASTNPHRPDPAGGKAGSQFRTRQTINRLNMYTKKVDKKARTKHN